MLIDHLASSEVFCPHPSRQVRGGASCMSLTTERCRSGRGGGRVLRSSTDVVDAVTSDTAINSTEVSGTEGNAQDLLLDPAKDTLEAVQNFGAATSDIIDGYAQQVGQAWSNLTEDLANASGDAVNQISGKVKDVTGDFTKFWNVVLSSLNDINETVSKQANNALDAASSAQDRVSASIIDAQEAIESVTTSAAQEITDSIPPEVMKVLQPLTEHPTIVLGTIGAIAVIATSVKLAKDVFPDTSTIPANKLLDILSSNDPSMLVDLRPEDEQAECGIPKLSKGALGKGVPVDFFKISSRQANLIKDARRLETKATALFIMEQQQFSSATTVILMASGREDCQPLRSTLLASGCSRVFILEDGFSGWLNAGLPILQGAAASYRVGVTDSIQKSASLLADNLSPLQSPSVYIPLVASLGLGLWIVFHYKLVLRTFGVVGLLGTALFFLFNRYESPKAMLEELLQLLTKGYAALSGKLQSLSGTSSMPTFKNVPLGIEDTDGEDELSPASDEETTKKAV